MDPQASIVCATDLQASGTRATDVALALARNLGAPLHLLHVADTGRDSELSQEAAEMQPAVVALHQRLRAQVDESARGLEAERSRCASAGVQCEAQVEEGRPWETIVEVATRLQPQLVVLGPHGTEREGLRERLLGSTATRVVRHAPCSVLVVPPELETVPSFEQTRWLVGVDFSPTAVEATRQAGALARACGGQLVLMNVLASPEALDRGDELGDELATQWAKRAREQLQQLHDDAAHGVPSEMEVHVGHPAQTLCRRAHELGNAVIVVGTHGRKGLTRVLLGSTAERCLRHSSVPVLVARRAELARD